MINGRVYVWPRAWLAIAQHGIEHTAIGIHQQVVHLLVQQFGLQAHFDPDTGFICVDLTHEQIRLGSPETVGRNVLFLLGSFAQDNSRPVSSQGAKKSCSPFTARQSGWSVGVGVNRLYAIYAARHCNTRGLGVFPHWRIRKEAASLKLHKLLSLDGRMLDAMEGDGIQTVAHALGAGEGRLRRYLGEASHAIYRSLQGEEIAAGVTGPDMATDQLYYERILPANTCSRAAIRRYMRQLCQQAVRNLRSKEQFARAVYYEIHPGGRAEPLRGVRCLDQAVPDVEFLVKILMSRMERTQVDQVGVMRLVVMFSGIGNLSGQGELLIGSFPLAESKTFSGAEKSKKELYPAATDKVQTATCSYAQAS